MPTGSQSSLTGRKRKENQVEVEKWKLNVKTKKNRKIIIIILLFKTWSEFWKKFSFSRIKYLQLLIPDGFHSVIIIIYLNKKT